MVSVKVEWEDSVCVKVEWEDGVCEGGEGGWCV